MTARSDTTGADPLAAEPQRFDFFQAVRRIEARAPGKIAPVGTDSNAATEAVRFHANPAAAFPTGDIAAYAPASGKEPARLTVNFLGLGGAFGPLPAPINELINQRRRARDKEADAAADFLNIFNHRLISLLVRVRRSHRLALQPGKPDEVEQARALQALLGLGTPHLRRTKDVPSRAVDRGLLHLAGLLGRTPRSLHAVERAVAYYLGVPVRGQAFEGDWLEIPEHDRLRLGRSGANNRLGKTALLGSRAWCQSAGIRLILGPLSLEQYDSLLPTGAAHAGLRRLLAFVVGSDVAVDLCLRLKTNEGTARQGLGLGARDLRLGWKSWLLSRTDTAQKPFEPLVVLHLGELSPVEP